MSNESAPTSQNRRSRTEDSDDAPKIRWTEFSWKSQVLKEGDWVEILRIDCPLQKGYFSDNIPDTEIVQADRAIIEDFHCDRCSWVIFPGCARNRKKELLFNLINPLRYLFRRSNIRLLARNNNPALFESLKNGKILPTEYLNTLERNQPRLQYYEEDICTPAPHQRRRTEI